MNTHSHIAHFHNCIYTHRVTQYTHLHTQSCSHDSCSYTLTKHTQAHTYVHTVTYNALLHSYKRHPHKNILTLIHTKFTLIRTQNPLSHIITNVCKLTFIHTHEVTHIQSPMYMLTCITHVYTHAHMHLFTLNACSQSHILT